MGRFPELPTYYHAQDEEINKLYSLLRSTFATLKLELDLKEAEELNQTTHRIRTTVTVTDVKRPEVGDIIYSINSDGFFGYKNTGGWTAL